MGIEESRKDSNAKRATCQATDQDAPFEAHRPAVVLVRPREEGNIGSVARAMANMGLGELLLVEPAAQIGGVARGFGVGGWNVLDGARRFASLAEALASFRRAVGTSATRLRARRRMRVIAAQELPAELDRDPPATPTALVFGPEDKGLRREELEMCSLVVRIDADAEHPTLNLAQAVLIVAYELFLHRSDPSAMPAPPAADPPATVEELSGFLGTASNVLARAGFDQRHIHRSLLSDIRRLTLRSGASSHEVRVLWRVANRLLQRLGTE